MDIAASTPADSSAEARRQIGLLFRLKWTLSWRGMRKNRLGMLGLVLSLLFFVPLSCALAVGIGVAILKAPSDFIEPGLRGAFLLVGTSWALAPILGFAMNDSYDVTKLFAYPIPARRIFFGAILGAFADISTALLMPAALVIIVCVGFHQIFASLVALVAIGLFIFQTIAFSQALLLMLAGVLKSRKFRDIAIVVVPLFWIGWQFLNQSYRTQAQKAAWVKLFHSPAWDATGYLPPGLAAKAIGASIDGRPLVALGCLAALAVICAVVVRVAGWLIERVYDGDDVGLSAPRAAKSAPSKTVKTGSAAAATSATAAVVASGRRGAATGPGLLDRLPGVIGAMVRKEFLYYVRDPYFRVVAMNLVYLIGFVGVSVFARNGGAIAREASRHDGIAPLVVGGALWLAALQQSALTSNLFGVDGGAAALLFSFPTPRKHLILGKTLAVALAILPLNAVLGAVLCVVVKRPDLIGLALLFAAANVPIQLAIGAVFSIFFPYRVQTRSIRLRAQNTGYGFLYTVVWLFSGLASLALYAPIALALGLPIYFQKTFWLWASVPGAFLYSLALYILAVKIAEAWALAREPEIVVKVMRAES